ncbi:cold-regulated protein 27-like [Rutidosis leptorrhynchoides]|uniref:cold-regulated protein 27-like n=1 Tax=Rutidosis leptorrhynchoides TaxID=125765 RepID=UPI003A99BDFA
MKDIVYPPVAVTVKETCSVTSQMTDEDFVEQEESSIMVSQKKDSSEWTNEKHSLYLKSIEASFVEQLYNSFDVQSCQTQKTSSSDAISSWRNHPKSCIPSGQFKVLQGGCWSKKSFKRENSHMKDTDRPHVSPGNTWIQHFTNGNRHVTIPLSSVHERLPSTATSAYPVSDSQLREEPGCANTEVTDQNFVEDTADKGKRQSSRKRLRTSVIAHSDNDQVVPFSTSDATEIGNSYVSSKK